MNKTILISCLLLLKTLSSHAQWNIDDRRHISVTGSAEVIIAPDEIDLEIILKAYNLDAKLPELEIAFRQILRNNNIPDDRILIGDSQNNWYSWWRYRSHNHTQKKFIIKVTADDNLLALMQDLNIEAIHSLKIIRTRHSRELELRKEVKITAVKAAKEKAAYLLESIDEKVGTIISLAEVPESSSRWRYEESTLRSNISRTINSEDKVENIEPIKIRYEVKAKFLIAE